MIETLKTNSFFNDTNKFKLPNVNLQFTSEDSNNKSNILNYDEFLRLNFTKVRQTNQTIQMIGTKQKR